MKKKVLGIFAAVVFVGVGATTVFAARPETGQNYVDANNDGVCDHAGTEDCKRNGNGYHVQRHGNGQQVRKGCGRNRK